MKKKVLFIFHKIDPASGGNASMLDVVRNIIDNPTFNIIAIIPKSSDGNVNPMVKVLDAMGVESIESRFYSARYQRSTSLFKTCLKYFKCFVRNTLSFISCLFLYFKLKSNNISLVYTNTSDTYVGAILARLLKVRHIWHFREFGLEDQREHHLFGDRFFYKCAEYFSSQIIVISKSLQNKVIRYIQPDKINMIYDDLFISDSDLVQCNRPDEIAVPHILMVGTLSPGKGQLDVMRALVELKKSSLEFKLGLAGHDDGEYAKFLKNETMILGVQENVTFLGFSNQLMKIRNDYNIGIIASHSEAFGRVTIEGMFSGLIIIGANSGANSELIQNNINGFIYNNPEELVSIIKSLMSGQVDVKKIRDNARNFANEFLQGKSSKVIMDLINKEI